MLSGSEVKARRFVLSILFGLCSLDAARGYSVLTHEAIIDSTWKDWLEPLLRKRFPESNQDQLRVAHGYAYGGAIIQDMGYYPFGSKFFSDLAHYVRSGDFVLALIEESQDLNEYAFALGSMAHYAADNNGHREAINRSVPIIYPKLERRFGRTVTYADDKVSHLKVEFSFDVTQVAQGNYAPEKYHDFIGFEVAQKLLERAVPRVYGLKLSDLINEELAIGTYRYAVSSIMPTVTKAAWKLKKDEIVKAQPSMTQKKFVRNLSRSSFEKKWGSKYQRPGFAARFLAFVFKLIPKVGPLRVFAFHAPTPETERLFMKSVNETLDQYRRMLAEHRRGALRLPNENFDTGEPLKPGTYKLADLAYAKLVDKLNGKPVPAELRINILAFYSDMNAPFANKKDEKAWKKLVAQLDALRGQESSSRAAAPAR
ncbi:MAG TPA: zinc dependent phospholipase C family protein [Bryobacteraceae bacterium]|nr:zinc dependent phospholipase C family protein [Bryobacteraceae bacterium]